VNHRCRWQLQVTESVVLPKKVLPCLQCGKQMNLTLVEPSGPKFELRTYKCIPCDIDESF
jgi:hypothetical protein